MTPRFLLALCGCLLAIGWPIPRAIAAERVIKDNEGMDCWIYTPDSMDPTQAYWVVVGVHGKGGNGKGAGGLAKWATTRNDCIVVGPSFHDGYQFAPEKDRAKLEALIASAGKDITLRPKIFIYGHSGGAQFAHRYLFARPDNVLGCSAHSGGTWETEVPTAPKNIPCAFSCGEKDTAKADPQLPQGRLEWFLKFKDAIEAAGYTKAEMKVIPNATHRRDKETLAMTTRCFERAISTPAATPAKDTNGRN